MDARRTLGAAVARQAPLEAISPTTALPLSAEQVYYDYAPRVFSIARKMLSTDNDAEDVTQDVLLQVVRKLPSFRGDSAFPTWLHRVTVNAALSHRRRQAVRQERGLCNSLDAMGGDDEKFETEGNNPTPPPEEVLVSAETRVQIDRAIERLPEAYRTVFVLADVEGLPNNDIAEQLDMSLPAVKSRLHRARAMLRESLSHYVGDTAV